MNINGKRIGFALTGSFCTFSAVIPQMKKLCESGADVLPIMSRKAYTTDTRFGKAADFVAEVESITGKKVIKTVAEAEPIGPKGLLDILIVAPCTGNTLGKIANGVTDTSVTMAVKAHLRNGKPVLLAVSTNDGLAGSAKNIGTLLNTKNIFFVPFGQDDHVKKPTSLVADMGLILPSCEMALEGKQIQPVIKA